MKIVIIPSKKRKSPPSRIEEVLCTEEFLDEVLKIAENKTGKEVVLGTTAALEIDVLRELEYDNETIGAAQQKVNTILAAMAMANKNLAFYAKGVGSKKKDIPMRMYVFRTHKEVDLFDYALDENIVEKGIKNAYEQPTSEEIERVKAFVDSYFAEPVEEKETVEIDSLSQDEVSEMVSE